jgi:hypothetical protein
VSTAGSGQIHQNDADNQGGFDAFTESDEKRRKHANSSCKSVATTR